MINDSQGENKAQQVISNPPAPVEENGKEWLDDRKENGKENKGRTRKGKKVGWRT